MERQIKRLILLIIAITTVCLCSCDIDTDVGSIPPDMLEPTDEPVGSNKVHVNVHVSDITTDNIIGIEFQWGIGTYVSAAETPFNKTKAITISDITNADNTLAFDVALSYGAGQSVYCNVRLLNSSGVCVGNLAQIWQSEPIAAVGDLKVIDVTTDGVYGEKTVEYKKTRERW
ncbi:MAG: hypothetical protein J6Y01_06805 [Spirochaetales bacterium]|nr:hypothetical protein [Spirochaetales bacterium]